MLDTYPSGRDNLMNHARWGMRFIREYHTPQRVKYYPQICQISGEVNASRNTAAGPAMRLLEAMWALNVRLRFPNVRAFEVWEENATIHLKQQYEDHEKARRHHIWKGVEIYLELRKEVLGPLPLIGVAPPDLQVETPVLQHQMALFRLHKRLSTTSPEHSKDEAWLQKALELAVLVPPTPQLLPTLKLLTQLVWFTYPKWDGQNYHRVRREYLSHTCGRPWLKNTEMGPLMAHIPT